MPYFLWLPAKLLAVGASVGALFLFLLCPGGILIALVILLVLPMSRLLLEPLLLVQSFLNGSGVLKLFLVLFNHSWDTRLAPILSLQLTSIRLLKGIIEYLALNHSRLEWVESRLWL